MSDFPLLLAAEMRVSRRTVQRWCEAGKVPGAYRTKGGHWRLRKLWLLRKPWRIKRHWKKYDRRIIEFVTRYTSDGGYFPPPIPDSVLVSRVIQWVTRRRLNPAPITTAEEARTFEWARTIIDWQIAREMNELTASQEFNDALEASMVLNGLCDDDRLPRFLKDIPRQERSRVVREHFKDLEERDPEKFRYLIGERDPETGHIRPTPILDVLHPRAYEAVETPERILKVKAAKLRLNMRPVTPASLADELKILVVTLYRRYRGAVKDVCDGVPVRDEVPIAEALSDQGHHLL